MGAPLPGAGGQGIGGHRKEGKQGGRLVGQREVKG